MKKKLLFKIILIFIVAIVIIISDIIAGLIGDTYFIIDSSKKFRSEASYLSLSTKVLLPFSNNSYISSYQQDTKPKHTYRYFRTNESGEIVGPSKNNFSLDSHHKIIFLGGSTTECNEVDEPFRFPFLVGQKLSEAVKKNIDSINIGVRGNTVHDSINLLINHPSTRDANLVVLMHNINDRLFLSRTGNYETINLQTPILTWQNFTNNIFETLNSFWDYISYKSNILFLIRTTYLDYNPWTGEKKHPASISEDQISFNSNNSEKAKKSYRENLTLFAAATRALNKTPVFMTQALGTYSKEQDDYNDIIRDVASEYSILLIDIARELQGHTKGLFLSDNIHLNNKGSKVISKIIANKLASNVLDDNNSININENKNIPLKINSCKSEPNNATLKDFSQNEKELLIQQSGRYPILSQDMKHLLYQSWTGTKEIVKLVDLSTGITSILTPEDGTISDRHAIFFNDTGIPSVLMARKLYETAPEFLVKAPLTNLDKITKISLPNNLTASIPAQYSNKLYFAGSRLNKKMLKTEAPNLYEFNLHNGNIKQLTDTFFEEWRPSPSHDGKYIYHIQNHDGNFGIYRLNTSSLESEKFFSSPKDEWDPNISINNKWLVFASKEKGSWNLILQSTSNSKKHIELTNDENDDWDPQFIPDSNAVIFASSTNNSEPHIYYQCLFGQK